MKITALHAWPVTFRLAEPYTIAYETVSTVTNVFLRVETNTRVTGYGCAAPDQPITGETPESAMKILTRALPEFLVGSDPLRYGMLFERLEKPIERHPAARAAIDMALWDIVGKTTGQPLWKLLGGFRERIRTSITIGILDEAQTLERAREYVKRGFKALKIKGGLDPVADAVRVRKVREAVGEAVELRFDANQGYTVEQTLKFVEAVREARLSVVEQPTPKNEPDQLGSLRGRAAVPIMADESFKSLRDAFRIARGGLADMVNVKLMKVGGVYEALEVAAVAHAANFDIMVGCMDEAGLAIAAGLHFALSRPNVKYADLDGHLDLLDDPTRDACTLRDGYLYPLDQPGLGFDIPAAAQA